MRNRVEPTTAWDRRNKRDHFSIAEHIKESTLPDLACDVTVDTEWEPDDANLRGYYLQLIRGYGALATMIDDLTQESIQSARQEGIPWADIGKAMNMSKQAAQQRYGATKRMENAR